MLSSDAITSTAIVVVHTMKYISLMPELNNADALEDNVLRNFGGAVENNLNHVLGNLSDTSEDLAIFTYSSYIDTSQLEDKLTSSKDKFTVFSLNTQSIHAKFNYLYPLFLDLCNKDLGFSAICLQETWLSEDDNTSIYHIPNYNIVHQGKTCSGHGGLIIYIHDRYQFEVRNLCPESRIWESLFIDIYGTDLKKAITLGNIYRPPKENNSDPVISTFIDELSPIIQTLSSENSETILVGDFNIDLLKVNEKSKYGEYLDLFHTNGFYPKITLPTRFSSRSCSLIDQIYCKLSATTNSATAGIIISNISDHLPYFISIDKIISKQMNPKYIEIRTNNEHAKLNYCEAVGKLNIMGKLNQDSLNDPNVNYDLLECMLTRLHNTHFPTKTVRYNKHKHKKSTWITAGIIRSIKRKDKLYRKLKQTPRNIPTYQTLADNLRVYQFNLKKIIAAAKRTHYAHLFDEFKSDARKTWDTIRQIIDNNRNKFEFPKCFHINRLRVTNNKDIANKFNEFFVNIGSKLANSIKSNTNDIPFTSYLKNKTSSTFSFSEITEETVLRTINELSAKRSTGHDSICTELLKRIKAFISSPLCLIVNQSLNTGIFPGKLKIAKVIPLYKKGDSTQLGNYRPISLLPSISKVFEKVVYNQLSTYLSTNQLLYGSQHGFRKQHSTETATLELVDTLLQTLDSGKLPISIFLDLSKAFDTLDHTILITKLKHYGISGTSLNWISNYLTDRQQFVQYKGTMSNTRPILTGVPQGSVLGPLLFIIYINDIHCASNKFKSILYADDTTLVGSLHSFESQTHPNDHTTLSNNINKELSLISEWLNANKLSLNKDKTKYMIHHFSQRDVSQLKISLNLEGKQIQGICEFNFLGTTIQDTLNWAPHTDRIANKISRTLGVMNKLKHFLPTYTLRTMYNSLILPHLNFSILSWGLQVG